MGDCLAEIECAFELLAQVSVDRMPKYSCLAVIASAVP